MTRTDWTKSIHWSQLKSFMFNHLHSPKCARPNSARAGQKSMFLYPVCTHQWLFEVSRHSLCVASSAEACFAADAFCPWNTRRFMGVLADKVVIKAGNLSPGSSGRRERRGQFLTVLLEGQRHNSTSTPLRQEELASGNSQPYSPSRLSPTTTQTGQLKKALIHWWHFEA